MRRLVLAGGALVLVVALGVGLTSCSDDPAPGLSDGAVDQGQGGGGDASTNTPDTQAPLPDTQAPDTGSFWPDFGPSNPDTWPTQPDSYAPAAPFGCQSDLDCFGQKCCPTPWGAKMCAPSC